MILSGITDMVLVLPLKLTKEFFLGKFGTGVLSYFIFLRWLFLLNVLIFFLVLLFIFIPQVIYRPSVKYSNLPSFYGTDLLDGRVCNVHRIWYTHFLPGGMLTGWVGLALPPSPPSNMGIGNYVQLQNQQHHWYDSNLCYFQGWFHGTELYYGHYTNKTIPISDGYGYEMPLAYMLTCASYLLLCLVIMVTR